MKQCHRFLQDTKIGSMHRIFENEMSGYHNASKQLEVVSWFHTNGGSVYSSPDPRSTRLSDINVFSKEYIKNLGHIYFSLEMRLT